MSKINALPWLNSDFVWLTISQVPFFGRALFRALYAKISALELLFEYADFWRSRRTLALEFLCQYYGVQPRLKQFYLFIF